MIEMKKQRIQNPAILREVRGAATMMCRSPLNHKKETTIDEMNEPPRFDYFSKLVDAIEAIKRKFR